MMHDAMMHLLLPSTQLVTCMLHAHGQRQQPHSCTLCWPSTLSLTCCFFPAPALAGLAEPFLGLGCALQEAWPLLLRCCTGLLRFIRRVASSRKESRCPEQNWSSSDKLAAGASSRGRGLRMVEDAMTTGRCRCCCWLLLQRSVRHQPCIESIELLLHSIVKLGHALRCTTGCHVTVARCICSCRTS
jgi:hypothetical protein